LVYPWPEKALHIGFSFFFAFFYKQVVFPLPRNIPPEPQELTYDKIGIFLNDDQNRVLLKKHTLEISPFVGPILGALLTNSIIYGMRSNFFVTERLAFGVDGGFAGTGIEPFTLGTVISEGDQEAWFVGGNVYYHFPMVISMRRNRVIPAEIFITVGGGIFNTFNADPMMNIGGGVKTYFRRWLVLRIDVRNYLVIAGPPTVPEKKLTANGLIMFGLSFHFPNITP